MKTAIENLNPKEKELLEYINFTIKNKGYVPSVREMCRALNVRSTSTIAYYIKKLEAQNLICRNQSRAHRSLSVIANQSETATTKPLQTLDAKDFLCVPLVGDIAGGKPIEAIENFEEVYYLPSGMFRGQDLFMLMVKGESMIEAGINNGDKVVIKRQPTAENGEIIAAQVDDCATVKRFFKEANRIRLQPENSAMQPMYYTNVTILGKVVGLIRNFK